MAEFNSCASLIKDQDKVREILEKRSNSANPLQDMLDMQNWLQSVLAEKLPKHNIKPFDIETKGQLIKWLDGNFDAIMDEFRELKNAVGGMSKGEKNASAVWKKWKSNHDELINERLDEMTEEDRLEMVMEFVDILHFIFNGMLALRISADDLYLLYHLKNYENYERYTKRDY